MKKVLQFPLLFALLILVLTACEPLSHAAGGAPTEVIPVTPQSAVPQTTAREAQVLSVEIRYSQMDPNQVNAFVHGNLSDSCSTLQDPQINFESGTFHIKIMAISPTDRGCIQIITPYEQTFALDTANLTPGTYTVIANGISTTFNFPAQIGQPISSLRVVVQASDGSLQVVNLEVPLNSTARPTFNNFLPSGGGAEGAVYVLDSNRGKAVVTNGNGFHDLVFVQSPTTYGLAVFQGDANNQSRLAWATQNYGGDTSSTIKISSLDGTVFDTLLTQDATNPPSQLMAQFFSPDGQWLYFSKEPIGLGGYILFGGASNLYKINITTKEVVELIPQGPTDGPQACLEAISADFRYVADHCAQNAITIRDLSSGGKTTIQPPADLTGYKFVGSARFSPDGSRLAFALAKGDQEAEQGWVAVSDSTSGGSKMILASQAGTYYTVAGWLDDQTLLVQSTNPLDCSPYCKSVLWTLRADGTEAQPAAEGSFLTAVPNDAIIQLPADAAPTPEATQTKTFSSDTYHYQFSYPADWKIQVNTAIPPGAGSNPEYVTVTVNDGSNLPQIAVEVLTDAPPMLGYEDCVKNFIFHDLPACQISLPAGQNPAMELWIFQNGTANFYIAMAYQDPNSSMQQFNDFVSSFEFTQYDATPTAATGCQDAAQYITDDGLDGTTYSPNTPFTKTWTVKNTGTCTWDSRYMVFQISGAFMTQSPGYWIVPQGQTVEPGQTVDISVGMTSPVENGNYRSYWGLKNADGQVMPIEGGANGNSFYVKLKVDNGEVPSGEVTATAIDIVPEQGSGIACSAGSTYFVHAYITTDGPTTASYEIGSTAGQIPAGYFEDNYGLSSSVSGIVVLDQADTKTINLRFVGPYPHPDDITVNLRVNGGEWLNTKLYCP